MEATQKIRTILTTSTFDVFEKMFFIYLEISDAGTHQYDLVTSIRFSGPLEGEIRLCFSDSVVLSMAENMVSMDRNDVTREMKEDCAKEAANMVCGAFVRTLDMTKVFQLTIPVCLPNESAVPHESPGSNREDWQHFESKQGQLGIMVGLKAQGI
jgi:chemotaxis protein CheY-P-specific phosphatase CheC